MMTDKSKLLSLGCLLMLGTLLTQLVISCGDSPKPVAPPQMTAEAIAWQGSGILWDTTAVKKDHSVVFFLAGWCGWCKKLKNETLRDSLVVKMLNESFNCVAIDPDQDSLVRYRDSMVTCRQFNNLFKVSAYPTGFFLARNGDSLDYLGGYVPAEELLRRLLRVRDST